MCVLLDGAKARTPACVRVRVPGAFIYECACARGCASTGEGGTGLGERVYKLPRVLLEDFHLSHVRLGLRMALEAVRITALSTEGGCSDGVLDENPHKHL